MSTLKVPDVVGFTIRAHDLLNTYSAELTAKGLNPTTSMAALLSKGTALSAKDEEQEAAKAALKIKTEAVDTLRDDAVLACSGACDLIISAFGRTSPQGQEATQLRRSITGPTQRRITTPSNPTPPNP